jgi:hypothetical protein
MTTVQRLKVYQLEPWLDSNPPGLSGRMQGVQ